jgi:hypothetical protein
LSSRGSFGTIFEKMHHRLLFAQIGGDESHRKLLFEAFLAVTWVIQLTKLVLVVPIVGDGAEERPSTDSKVYLVVGTLCSFVGSLPLTVWAHVVGKVGFVLICFSTNALVFS